MKERTFQEIVDDIISWAKMMKIAETEKYWLTLKLSMLQTRYELDTKSKETIDTGIYDKEDIYPNCTVQILTNTETGEMSVGWWENERSTDDIF